MKALKITTPRGITAFPHLNTPDTKWRAEGEYKTGLVFDPNDETVSKMLQALEAYYEEAYEDLCLQKGSLNKETRQIEPAELNRASFPWKDQVDKDSKEPTGMVILTPKMKALVKPKNGPEFTQKPRLFDCNNNTVTTVIRGGSTVRAAIEAVPYFNEKDQEFGITLRLKAVQVHELSGYGNAESYGFEVEEGGYTADDDATAAEPETANAGAGDADSLDGDF